MQLNLSPFSLDDLQNTLYNLFINSANNKDLNLTINVANNVPEYLIGDNVRIRQVLINLLKNAAESVDHTGKEAPNRLVELNVISSVVEGQDRVEFTVKDTGGGLAPEVLNRLFEAFFSTKTEGLGIGLNLCRSIVESHQGRMHAHNLYNDDQITGCCFSFWLPAISSKMPVAETIFNDSRSYS